MSERCDFCGRFMKHHWYLATDEPNSWEDYWSCRPVCEKRALAWEALAYGQEGTDV